MQKRKKGVLSNSYRIFETEEFIKRLSKLSSPQKDFIQKKLDEYVYPKLKIELAFGKNIKKLKGYQSDTWRYRIGKFRIFYSIDYEEKVVYILTVDYKKDVYR